MSPYFFSQLLYGPLLRPHVKLSGSEHIPQQQPCVFVSNHIDYLDGVLLALALAPVTKRRIYFITRTRNYWWYRSTITINPHDRRQAVDQAVTKIRQGFSVHVFIEGERNTSAALGRPKSGAARIALRTGVPVIPIGLIGPAGISFRESIHLVRRNTQPLHIQVGQPRQFPRQSGEPSPEHVRAATECIAADVASLCEKSFQP